MTTIACNTVIPTNVLRIYLMKLIFLQLLVLTEQLGYTDIVSQRHTVEGYCNSFKSCRDCKRGALQCEWCHNTGCTNNPRTHCPRRVFLDNIWKRYNFDRYCTEVVTKNPIFIAANLRQFIKLDLVIDDLTLYERNVVLEIQLEQKIMRVKGTLDNGVFYSDTIILRTTRAVTLGYVRLFWEGVEPHSNMVLMIVYKCSHLARNCMDCQALNHEFKCGWCKETKACSLVEECPRQAAPWIDKRYSCGKYDFLSIGNSKNNIRMPH